jgi:hypothetical protein
MGPTAKALGPLAHGYAQFGCRRHPRYEPTSILETVPADGHYGRQGEETKTSVRRRFLGSSSDKRACHAKMGAPELKNNRSHPLFCRGRHVADLVDRDSVRSAGALPYLTISPVILIWQRLVHLYRV